VELVQLSPAAILAVGGLLGSMAAGMGFLLRALIKSYEDRLKEQHEIIEHQQAVIDETVGVQRELVHVNTRVRGRS
jgi:hypothetical protein